MSYDKQSLLGRKKKDKSALFEIDMNKTNKKIKEEPQFKENYEDNSKNKIMDNKKETSKKQIYSISQYYLTLIKEDWKNKNILDLRKYCDSIGINPYSNYELLNILLNNNFDLFIEYYSKYQFTLEIKQRKAIQEKIKNLKVTTIIKNNFIKNGLHSIRDLFLKICDLILNINLNDKNSLENLKNEIINNGVYIEDYIYFLIPVNFGNIELKFNKLIIDVLFLIFGKNMGQINILDNNKKQLIKNKITLFTEAKIFFQKSGLYDDQTFFKISDYLINCYYVYFEVDSTLKDYDALVKIISCCLPFELDIAKNFIEKAKKLSYNIKFTIDNIPLYKYDTSKLTKDSIINLSYDKKIVEIIAEDVNWNFSPNIFFQLFISDNFTLCFRFPKLNEINYINLNEDIKKNYKNLFRIILKSKIMEQSMNIDSDASDFKYPFNDDKIIQEIEDHILFVPFPVKKFYSYSDKMSFTIFLNSHINTIDFRSIFIDFDNILKSKFHEIKNIYRLYMHINDQKISLKAPEIKRETLLTNELLKDNSSILEKNKKNLEELYKERIIQKNSNDLLDYGDIVEFAMNGDKRDVFFIQGSLFYLTEKNWKKESKDFFDSYFKVCKEKIFDLNPSKDELFIKSIMEFFKIKKLSKIVNDVYTEKRADSKSTNITLEKEIKNAFIMIPKINHCRMKK